MLIGAGRIASGRNPSMEMITTRRAAGTRVGVMVGMGDCVAVGDAASVAVAVKVGGSVSVAGGVAVSVWVAVGRRRDNPGALESWQASRMNREKIERNALRVREGLMK